ncbi:MAG: GGDEF domain-containing protein, partial [Bacillota bacterium]|nr:GGDEF domain-containing protein [Bacillota bacterium]
FIHLLCALFAVDFFYDLFTDSFSDTDRLLHYSIFLTAFLVATSLLSAVLLTLYLWRWRHTISAERQRYFLLEKFSGTVLFDYDYATDVIHFTPNAAELFQLNATTHSGFLGNLDALETLYAGDHDTIKRALTGRMPDDNQDLLIRIKDSRGGKFLWYVVQFKYLYRRHRLVSVIGKIDNVDDQKRHEETLLEQAQRDGLTGLYNKITTERQIEQAIDSKQDGIMILFDIDDFKKINDGFGHLAGDNVLRLFATCLQRIFRANDILGRIGGDELVVYMRSLKDTDVVTAKLEALRQMMADQLKEGDMKFSASTGIAKFPQDGDTFEALFRAADAAMYRTKRREKG